MPHQVDQFLADIRGTYDHGYKTALSKVIGETLPRPHTAREYRGMVEGLALRGLQPSMFLTVIVKKEVRTNVRRTHSRV